MVLRPDEESSQEAIERDKRNKGLLKTGVKTAATIGAASVAPAITSRLAPFFSSFIPTDLAVKGISKISPKLGEFLKKGQSMGLDMKEGVEYIKEKLEPKEKAKEKPKDNRNIIEQYSPELHQFIAQHVASGRSPEEAGALAQVDGKFANVIKKLSADHKVPWSQILNDIYGGGQYGGAVNAKAQSPSAQPQQTQQPPQQQGSPPDQRLDRLAGLMEQYIKLKSNP